MLRRFDERGDDVSKGGFALTVGKWIFVFAGRIKCPYISNTSRVVATECFVNPPPRNIQTASFVVDVLFDKHEKSVFVFLARRIFKNTISFCLHAVPFCTCFVVVVVVIIFSINRRVVNYIIIHNDVAPVLSSVRARSTPRIVVAGVVVIIIRNLYTHNGNVRRPRVHGNDFLGRNFVYNIK